MKATKYTTAMSDPHSFVEFPDSGSHAFPAMQDSIICCHASPVAHLLCGLQNEKISVFITCFFHIWSEILLFHKLIYDIALDSYIW